MPGYVEFLEKVLNDFHQAEDEDRRRWCLEHLAKRCDTCEKTWCKLHPQNSVKGKVN